MGDSQADDAQPAVVGANGQKHRNTAGLRPPWPKGKSGNPGGFPKGGIKLRARLRRALREHPEEADAIVAALIAEAKCRPETTRDAYGNSTTVGGAFTAAQKLVWERHDGPVPAAVEVRGVVTHMVISEEETDF